jgi:hypothetical protein
MRVPLAIAIFLGGVLVLNTLADAAPKSKRRVQPPYSYAPSYPPPGYSRREQVECERARNEDPAGQFAGYPCWAREIFGRGFNSGGRGG